MTSRLALAVGSLLVLVIAGEAVQFRRMGTVADASDSRLAYEQYEISYGAALRPLLLLFDLHRSGFQVRPFVIAEPHGVMEMPPGLRVVIRYPACANPREVSLPIKDEAARVISSANAILPIVPRAAGYVGLQGFVDVDRTFRFPTDERYCPADCEGPAREQLAAAIRACADWRIEAGKMNGVPYSSCRPSASDFKCPEIAD